jgi:hypothetical protein
MADTAGGIDRALSDPGMGGDALSGGKIEPVMTSR